MPNFQKPNYPTRPYLVQDLIKERSFTLIGGGSGSGKSTWLFQGLEEWLKYQTFHGYKCHRMPKFYLIAFDRLIESIYDHLQLLKINFKDDNGEDWLFIRSCALDEFTDKFPLTLPQMNPGDLLIFEGIDMLVAGGNLKDFGTVNHLCRKCKQAVDTMGISIIGVMGASKARVDLLSKRDPFDRLLGSGVWQRTSETNIIIDKGNPEENEDLVRVVNIRPRFSKPVTIEYQFTPESRLIKLPKQKTKAAAEMHKLTFIQVLPEQFDLFTAVRIGKDNGISRATVCRYLNSLTDEDGLLERVTHGNYRKRKPTPENPQT